MSAKMTPQDKRCIREAMRVPVFTFVVLIVCIVTIVLLGWLAPSRTASFIEFGLTLCMIATVLLFSMEVWNEAPILRFYSFLGFCWLSIMLIMTMVDYATR